MEVICKRNAIEISKRKKMKRMAAPERGIETRVRTFRKGIAPPRRPGVKKGRRIAPALLSGLHADYSAVSTATLMTPSCRLPKSR